MYYIVKNSLNKAFFGSSKFSIKLNYLNRQFNADEHNKSFINFNLLYYYVAEKYVLIIESNS